MPRSSRHKSSKHSSRDAKGYSDSERDSSFKVNQEIISIASKESPADKRKLNGKDPYGTSKGRKERVLDDGESDRWNGGEEEHSEGSRKSRSKRKEESEGKHRQSSRKERDSLGERERKGRSYGLVDDEDEQQPKQLKEITEVNAVDGEPENKHEKRIKRRDGSGDGDKHLDNVGDSIKRQLPSRDDISKNGKQMDERHGDKHRDDKQRDEHSKKERTSIKSAEKHLRDDEDMKEKRLKKSKPLDHDLECEADREHDMDSSCDHVYDRYQDNERDRDRNRNRNGARDRDRDSDRDQDWDRERDEDQERGRDKERNRDRETDNDRERGLDYDGSHFDGRSSRYKDNRGRKKSPDDLNDSKYRVIKGHYSDMEKKPLSGGRIKSEADRRRPKSSQHTVDSAKNRRLSPNSNSNIGTNEYRYLKSEESKYRDPMIEQRPKEVSLEVTCFSGVSERNSTHTSMEKPNKMDDGHPGELSFERFSNSKSSPMGLVERSPSSASIERRHMNRSGVRRSVDVEDTGRRSNASMDPRDVIATDDRIHRDLPLDKPSEYDSQGDPSVFNRTSQRSSLLPPQPGSRAGVDSASYMGALENDGRFNSSTRYKRSGDPSFARGQGNSWSGVPGWPSPVPNGFMPFQHGPPHGGFQAIMPQFPSPLFGVRPSMEINHAGIPYHIPDTDRFSGHLRPLGWQNIMDGSGVSHLHGWDGNNSVFRNESHMYGAPDWDQSRHPMNRRDWEPSGEMWKGQNGDVDNDLPSSQKENYSMPGTEDEFAAAQAGSKSQHEHKFVGVHVKDVESSPSVTSAIEKLKFQPETEDKMLNPCKRSSYNDSTQCFRAYLSKLDISRDLAHPELYSQCVQLLYLEKATFNIEDGERARLKISPALHNPPVFPAIKDTVFQRAMDLYKQCIEPRGLAIVNAEDFPTTTNPVRGGDHIWNHNTDELLVSCDVEMTDAVVSTCDQRKEETLGMPAPKDGTEELASTADLEVQEHVLTPCPVNLTEGHNKQEESSPVHSFRENEEGTIEVVTAEVADGTPNDSSKDDSTLPTCDSEIKNKDCGEGGMSIGGDGVNCPICLSGGLKPELNECKSVVVSRIHHSPG